jgi:hypothetical protein
MVTIYPDKGTIDMAEEIAGANVNRSYTLAATNIAIFSFMMFFLYPRFEKGSINPYLFQCTLAAMAVSTFSLVLASILYYRSSVGRGMTDPERMRNTRQADGFWLVGYSVMFLGPCLVLFLVHLRVVALFWLALWLAYVLSVIGIFRQVRTPRS